VSPAKTAEPLEMPFEIWTRVNPRKDILHRSPDPRAKGQLLGERTGPSYLRTVCSKGLVVYVAIIVMYFFTAALRSRCGHYIFALWFLLSFFFLFSSLA